MSNIRLIVSDVDGTLLSPDHQLTGSVKEAVRRFTEAGGLFTIATGRPSLTVRSVVDELELKVPQILCNGAVIADTDRVWETTPLEVADLAAVMKEADRLGITVLLFQEDGIRALRRTDALDRFEHKERIACELLDPESDEWTQWSVQKLLFIGEMTGIRRLWSDHSPLFRESYATFQSEDDFWEIVPGEQSKGEALRRLMAHLELKPEQVMAIGNQMNDLDMIELAGIGVAVGNSHPDLMERADYVCSAHYGEGVVEAIERFGLGREAATASKEVPAS
ncbi:haloacid dehalogenase [Paenibacillus sp. J31TS4]|uniref:HAD family hydrolase n=1 Tax=Paenibacillus sp. J31TS4 TaxID=2807195 RepID=UPI001B29896A|nr:HAD family hydrolase [Paenibacillus sp. J31TS4]GIP40349.1 haloacid dehalogenase [Paenibacillus sp. J31TS4]